MQYRILVLRNKIDFTVPGFDTLRAWLKSETGADLLYSFRDIAEIIKPYTIDAGPGKGAVKPVNTAEIIQKYLTVGAYDHAVLMWNAEPYGSAAPASTTGYAPLLKCILTDLPVKRTWTGRNGVFWIMSHEFFHGWVSKLVLQGIRGITDTMDAGQGTAAWEAREANVYNPDGNRARHLAMLRPYFPVLFPDRPVLPQNDLAAKSLLATLWERLFGLQREVEARKYIPPFPTPNGLREIVKRFGDQEDVKFEDKFIVRFEFPIPMKYQGRVVKSGRCHILIKDQLEWCLKEIKRRGLEKEVTSYGGVYEDRNIRGISAPSTHAWGIAIDIEPSKYPLGSTKRLPAEIIEIFAKAGFTYGGDFPGRKDPQHFQYARNY